MLSYVLAKARTKDNNAMRFVSTNRTNLFFAYYYTLQTAPKSGGGQVIDSLHARRIKSRSDSEKCSEKKEESFGGSEYCLESWGRFS
jgi:hypothetical protein